MILQCEWSSQCECEILQQPETEHPTHVHSVQDGRCKALERRIGASSFPETEHWSLSPKTFRPSKVRFWKTTNDRKMAFGTERVGKHWSLQGLSVITEVFRLHRNVLYKVCVMDWVACPVCNCSIFLPRASDPSSNGHVPDSIEHVEKTGTECGYS